MKEALFEEKKISADERKKHGGKIILLIFSFLLVFGAGFLTSSFVFGALHVNEKDTEAAPAEPVQTVQTAEIQLRVVDGEVEWNDGVFWHSAGALKKLAAADPFAQNSVPAISLSASGIQTAGSTFARSIGTVPKKYTVSAASGNTAGQAAGTSPAGNTAQPSGGTPAAPETPAPAAPAAPEAPADTGDGEDVEWSGDILG